MHASHFQRERHDFLSTPRGPECALERRYPRIARELAARWQRPGIEAYLDSLLIDARGNRMGFPSDVLQEIMFLAGIRWYLSGNTKRKSLESPRDEFSFCSSPLVGCASPGAWVLV